MNRYKVLFLFLVSSACAGTVTAQDVEYGGTPDSKEVEHVISTTEDKSFSEDENTIIINKFRQNWEFDFSVGTSAYLGEYTSLFRFLDWWSPMGQIGITKWATPGFGYGLRFNVRGFRGLHTPDEKKATFRRDDDPIYEHNTKFLLSTGVLGEFMLHGDFDFTNLIGGYKVDRMYHCIGEFGAGVIFPMQSVNFWSVQAVADLMLRNQFRINKTLAINLNLHWAFVSDNCNGICYLTSGDGHSMEDRDEVNLPFDYTAGISLGMSVNFGFVDRTNRTTQVTTKESWVPMATFVETSTYIDKIKDASTAEALAVKKEEVAKADSMLIRVKDELAFIEREDSVKEAEQIPSYWIVVNFPCNRWTISKREEVVIMSAADFIKIHPDYTFEVYGYADKFTGNEKGNVNLSLHRSEVVYDMLVNKYGVNPAQLERKWFGGVGYMYVEDKQCARSTVIRLKENPE